MTKTSFAQYLSVVPIKLCKASHVFKGAFSSLRQFLAIEGSLKMMKNAFYFTSTALFVLAIFNFFVTFRLCNKTTSLER